MLYLDIILLPKNEPFRIILQNLRLEVMLLVKNNIYS